MEVYNTDWHCLAIKDQKNVLVLLQMAQRPFHMTYGIGNLDLFTFVEVTISIFKPGVKKRYFFRSVPFRF
jgi:hypothetical protein